MLSRRELLGHFFFLFLLLYGVEYLVNADPDTLDGEFIGISTFNWFTLAILSPIVHQAYVLLCWRLELHGKRLTKAWGDRAFPIYKMGFAILILSRILTIIPLAIAGSNTLSVDPTVAYSLAGILFVPAAYLFYSVRKYFGMDRAFGIDHFEPEAMRNAVFVKKGIFKYTSNGMYIFGFFMLWIPGLIWLSKAALIAALFNHTYIWVHYYFTELPDIKLIYKSPRSEV